MTRLSLATDLINLFEYLRSKLYGVSDWFRIAIADPAFVLARKEYRQCL